jgi:hypothetical protein
MRPEASKLNAKKYLTAAYLSRRFCFSGKVW